MQKAILLLEDGTEFHGLSIGAIGTYSGEIAFNTGMTGYQEIFTDPSYYNQLLVMATSHIGNYGATPKEVESDSIKIAGLICKKFSHTHSRYGEVVSLQDELVKNNVGGISDIDTRALVRHIRDKGAMNAIVSSEILDLEELKEKLDAVPSMKGLELASKVSTKVPYYLGNEEASYRIAALDLGIKKNILRCLTERDCFVKVFPAKTPYNEIKAWDPDGYFLSNGPGDPAPMKYAINTAKAILNENMPLFGICLGHQILAQAVDIPTYKMHNGHRGINHPVKNIITGQCEITSQNHGFGVSPEAIEANKDKVEVTHVNLNDGTIEGIRIKGKPAFSVQYHPESSPGPHDSRYLFDDFVNMVASHNAVSPSA